MIPQPLHTMRSQQARSLMTSWCVKRPYLLVGSIVTPATPSSFDRLANQEGGT